MSGEAMVAWLWRLRWVLLWVGLPLWALVASGAWWVSVDNGVHAWFVEGDPALERYEDFQRTYGNDEVVLFLLQTEGGALGAEGIARLRAATAAAAAVEGVARVDSLATLIRAGWEPRSDGDSALVVGPALEGEDLTRLATDPLVRGRFLSKDERSTLIFAWMERHDHMDGVRDAVLARLYSAVEGAVGETPRAGIGVIFSALNQASSRDVGVLGGASYLLVFALLYWTFRKIGPVLLTLVAVGASAAVPLGLMGWLDTPMNTVTMVLPTLVFILGIADAVHTLHAIAATPPGPNRAKIGISSVFWPLVFTTLTTAVGLASLSLAQMPVVRQLGLFGAAGVLAALAIWLPLAMIFGGRDWFIPGEVGHSWITRGLGWAGALSVRRPVMPLLLAVAVFGVSISGWPRVVADTTSIEYFPESHRVRRDSLALEEAFGPSTPLEWVVKVPGGARTPEALSAIAAWTDRMGGDPEVGWTFSVADYARGMNQLLEGGAAEAWRVPADAAALEQALWLYESAPDAPIAGWVREDWAEVRVTTGLKMMSAVEIGEAISRLEGLARLPEGMTAVPTGYLPVYVEMMGYVVSAQVQSLAGAVALIWVLLLLLLRSWKLALLAIPPNALPLAVALGAMGWAGIPLDAATATIAAIALGLVVDDTVHFLFRYRTLVLSGRSPEEAVAETLASAGVAMAITSVALILGFSILILATVKSVAWFGLLIALAAAVALAGDLLVLPALLIWLRPKLS